MKFYGKIVNGSLQIINLQKVMREIKELGEDGLVEITLLFKDQRSLPQNNYFHGIMIPEFRKALNEVGYRIKTDDEAKRVFKAMFLTRHVENEITKEEMPITIDTSTLSKKEMNDVWEEAIQFCSEHMNYHIPYPNEDLTLGLDNTI